MHKKIALQFPLRHLLYQTPTKQIAVMKHNSTTCVYKTTNTYAAELFQKNVMKKYLLKTFRKFLKNT